MRSLLVALTVLIFLTGCTKENGTSSVPTIAGNSVASSAAENKSLATLARYSGVNYSQSVSVSDANSMIGSYLSSVHYPAQDTALRSLTFDADTLRRYLANNDIKTLKFFMAHRPGWAAGSSYGRYSGYKPSAMTMVVVGLSEDDDYILNDRNEVYEHFFPCPHDCPKAGTDALILVPATY